MASKNIQDLQDIANLIRRDCAISTTKAGSGHLSTCLSCEEIMSVLFFNEMKYEVGNASNKNNDEFILSKGHAAPALYSCLKRAGCLNKPANLDLNELRKLNSVLEGHPMPNSKLPWIKVATGSLGQGLSIGVGMALASKLQKRNFKVYVLLGDGELAEGSNYEACQLAVHLKLDNLTAIVDVNRQGQIGETMFGHDLIAYKKRFEGFGWNTVIINGHKVEQIVNSLNENRKSNKPTIILAKTLKGKGISFIEDKEGWHGKAMNENELNKALKEIPDSAMPKFVIQKPAKNNFKFNKKNIEIQKYTIGDEVATRTAYGKALANLAISDSSVIAVDADVGNSTKSKDIKEKTPKQFVECYIAEQNMIGVALGLSKKGFNVFCGSFGAFLTRAHDQIRMAALSNGNLTINGSHAGVAIGYDGASQMGLEDISMFRSLPNSIIFYPSDAASAEKIVNLCSKLNGIKYIRTTRNNTPVIYDNKEDFKIGDFKILRQTLKDKAVIAGAGITLHESLKAYEELNKKGINTAVIDLYCIKPFNKKKFIKFIKKHGNKVIVAEDHYPEGGIGEMISEVVSNNSIQFKHLAIREIPHSGKTKELLNKYGINSKAIINEVKKW